MTHVWKRILLGVPGGEGFSMYGSGASAAGPKVYTMVHIDCGTLSVPYCLPHALNDTKHRSIDLQPRNVLLLKSHIKAIHRAAVDSDTDDDLINEFDFIASVLQLTSYQGV
jgi:hypothetical protein